ncbi:MAG: PAS domain S-box protein [Phototrophicaceae bacterium]
MAHLQELWQLITSPVDSIQSQYERERIALYSGLMFILTCIFLIISISLIFTSEQVFIFKSVFSFAFIFYAVLYLYSRTAYYRWSARLYTWFTIGLIIYSFIYIAPSNSRYVLNFITVPIMMAGFLLSRREAILSLILTIFLLILAEAIHPDYQIIISGIPLLTFIIGCLTIAGNAITERFYHQAIDNEARYCNLMEANFEGILIIDKDSSRILDTNSAIEKLLGYSSAEMLNQIPLDFVSPEAKDIAQEIWAQGVLESALEIRLKHKLGYFIDTEITMRPYTFFNQPAFVLTVLDISERKQVESRILESEERFRAIFNESSHYFGILDTSGKVLEFNQSTYDKFGLAPNGSLGHYLWDFDIWAPTKKLKERTKELIQDALAGKPVRYDFITRDKNGHKTYLDFSMKAIKGTNETAQMLIFESRDTTDYYLANAKSREYEQRYQAMFDHTTDAVFIYTLDGKFLSINKRAEEMLQISAENLAHLLIYDFVADDEKKQSKNLLGQILNGKEFSHIPERKMQRGNGEVFYAETLGMVVKDNHGTPRYVQSMIRDISERKRQEKIRFDSALQRERTQLLSHFIDHASHYFRTPITNMKTRLYLLPRVIDKPDKRNEQIKVLNFELERVENLLSDLLTVLRLQKDDTEYSISKVKVNDLLIEVRQSFEGRSNYKNFEWSWHNKDIDAIVIGDKARLSKAIFNLVKNAMIYTPQDGKITIHSFIHNDLIAINVINSCSEGHHGISEDDLPHIFNDFYRGQDAMEKDSTGTGLGLTITKMIAERHQGRVFVATRASGDTQFQIVLPNHIDWKQVAPPLPESILEDNTPSE